MTKSTLTVCDYCEKPLYFESESRTEAVGWYLKLSSVRNTNTEAPDPLKESLHFCDMDCISLWFAMKCCTRTNDGKADAS